MGSISYPNVSQAKQDKKVEKQSFQGSLEKVIQNKKMTEPQDSIEFSEESDVKKLEKIKQLNDATDFSGMTDIEKYTVIIQRYEKAFPDLPALFLGSTGNSDIAEHFTEEINRQDIKNNNLYQVYRGYDKMTDEQKWESIQSKYNDPQNGIEQISALAELKFSGLIDKDTVDHMFFVLQQDAKYAGAESNGRDYVKEKLFLTKTGGQFAYEYLQNNKVDFNEIATKTKQFVRYDDPKIQREFNYEVDYITELMNALEERED